jgi:putative holliday junction resolvase
MPEGETTEGLWLGFDFGLKTIGVAKGNAQLGTADPLSTVRNVNGTPEWATVDSLVSEWQPVGLVVGLPLTANGEMQPIAYEAKGFGKRCAKRFSLPVYWMDERYSSMQASETLAQLRQSGQRRKRTRKEDVDTLAAALILERWFAR